jgi:endonuclease/exonuclease/phosphatase family metal-dependent hydrolase
MTPKPDAVTIRVLTWNVWGGTRFEEREERLRRAIEGVDPDLVSLHEVVKDDERDQAEVLLGSLGLHYAHGSSFHDGTLGTAIASRWEPTEVVGRPLPGRGDVLAATVPLPIGEETLFIAAKPTPFFWGEAERCEQALAIAELEERMRRPAPTIIAGDFDASPDHECMRFYTGRTRLDGRSVCFDDAWELAGDGGPGHTWTTDNPGVQEMVDAGWVQAPHHRRIDYILVGTLERHPDVRRVVKSCSVAMNDPLEPESDHYAVVSEIEMRVAT